MSEESDSPVPYHVSYSGSVRQRLVSLSEQAIEHGLGVTYLASLEEVDRRLRIYPQFGEPLADLKLIPAQLWIGTVWPLVLRYSLDDERRLVMVVAPFLLLPRPSS